MQRYTVEIAIEGADPPDRDRVRQALEAALEHSTAREALDEALFSTLFADHKPEDTKTPAITTLRLVLSQPDGDRQRQCYDLSIDGPTFRAQRELILHFFESWQQQMPLTFSPEQGELLEGLVNLTDAIADQAADRYGIECLL